MRGKLSDYLNTNDLIFVALSTAGPETYDHSCFGVDANEKLSDDRYMIFYNQVISPAGEIKYTKTSGGASFRADLSKLPPNITKLVFTASIDGDGTMSGISEHLAEIKQGGETILSLRVTGADFGGEKAIVSLEIYKKDNIWRYSAVARGFNGGLSDLLKAYGGEEASEQQPQQDYQQGYQQQPQQDYQQSYQQGYQQQSYTASSTSFPRSGSSFGNQ